MSEWYWNKNGKSEGPCQLPHLVSLLRQGKLRGHDLVYCSERRQWKAVLDWEELRSQILQDRQALQQESDWQWQRWVVLQQNIQQGPYSTQEVQQGLKKGSIPVSSYVWTEGMDHWISITDLPPFNLVNF